MELLLGAVFIYQGFNDYCGWMHLFKQMYIMYAEKKLFEKEKLFYEYDSKLLPVSEKVSQLVP
jgi:hypothetical protein